MNRARRVVVMWAVTMLLASVATFLMIVDWNGGESFTPHSLMSFGFGSLGALIMLRRPHRIGALFLGFGGLTAFTGFIFQLCPQVDAQIGGVAGICGDGSRLGLALWPLGYLFFGSLLLLFPTGRLPSPRWRPLAWVFVVSWGALALGGLAVGEKAMEEHVGFLPPVAVWSLAVVAVSPIFRIRRADPIERQQLRWLGYVVGVALLLIAIGIPLDLAGQQRILNVLNVLIFLNALLGIPVAITVAILRYRLYEIDLIVNRTLVYALLTGALAAVYLASVFVLQTLLAPITADSDLAVAGSTLAVAALFRPVRSRVQAFIDRRFYRRKYDAAETLDEFSVRLRDEVELQALSEELVDVVGRTMQPAHAALWLRSEPGS